MAQKKGLIYRLTMGKDNLPDFTPNRLPGSRWVQGRVLQPHRRNGKNKPADLTVYAPGTRLDYTDEPSQTRRRHGCAVFG